MDEIASYCLELGLITLIVLFFSRQYPGIVIGRHDSLTGFFSDGVSQPDFLLYVVTNKTK